MQCYLTDIQLKLSSEDDMVCLPHNIREDVVLQLGGALLLRTKAISQKYPYLGLRSAFPGSKDKINLCHGKHH